jgi:hypothetical protein
MEQAADQESSVPPVVHPWDNADPSTHTAAGISAPPVTLSQVAELAGVRPSAVSNWRKRFADFPEPMGSTTGGRDVFSLHAVEAWLASHDRLSSTKAHERLVFEAADILRSELDVRRITEVLCAALALAYVVDDPTALLDEDFAKTIRDRERVEPSLTGVFTPLEWLAPPSRRRLLELAARVDHGTIPDLFELALRRHPRFVETRTSDRLVELLVELGLGAPAGKVETIFDPAAGEGNLLLAATRTAGRHAIAVGQELNEAGWRIARQRFRVHDLSVTLSPGNTLLHDAHPALRADLVLCDPPYGVKVDFPDEAIADPRWQEFGLPKSGISDYAWLQHIVYHLAPEGRGYILLPLGTLARRGRGAETRARLLRRGVVEAIIALPPRAAEHTAIPLALWVVRPPKKYDETAPVLLVDAASDPGEPSEPLNAALIQRIAHTIREWRAHARVLPADRGFAAAVPIIELLGPTSSLVPAQWVSHGSTMDFQQRRRALDHAVGRIRSAHEELLAGEIDVAQLHSEPDSLTWISISDLIADGRVELIRGFRLASEDERQEGVHVIRAHDLDSERSDAPHYVDPTALRNTSKTTVSGDIVVSALGGRVKAVVDRQGGSLLALPVQALRLRGHWLDPELAAAFLASRRNQRLAGAAAQRVQLDLHELQLPVIPLPQAAELGAVLGQLDASERLARTILTASRDARDALLDLGDRLANDDADRSHHRDYGG